MNGHDDDTSCGVLTADRDPPSVLEGRVGTVLGRRVRELHIGIRDSGLVLHGRADSYHAKQLAQHAATAATGLPVIANRIEVIFIRRGGPPRTRRSSGERKPGRHGAPCWRVGTSGCCRTGVPASPLTGSSSPLWRAA